ncbi:MAG: 50S ribosomal protein L18 [Candidatus Aenigmatarchaeota archaeon]
MKLLPTTKMPFRRRREGKTDYKQRLELLKSKKPRLVVRRSLKYIKAQIVIFDKKGDRTIASASSYGLKKFNWNFATDNLPSAYLTGLMMGKKAKEKGIDEAVLDAGLYTSTKGSRIYAVVKGAIDAGLKISVDESMLPSEDRISGKHIANYLKKFSDLPKEFERVKEILMGK